MFSQLFKRITFWLALLGLGILAVLVNATTSHQPVPPPLLEPSENPFSKGIGASGIIEAIHENTRIGVPLPGLVVEVPVKVWRKVKPGDVLLRLDDREMRARLMTQRAELTLREAELARARRQHDRFAKIDRDVIAREELEKRADELPVAEAAVENAKAAIRETNELLDRCIVRSPIEGTVLQVNTRAGEYVSPGDDVSPLVLGSIDELQVRVDVDEQLAPRVRQGSAAVAFRKGATSEQMALDFIRIEPFIIPKKNLTGDSMERVDTRVLQLIFRIRPQPALNAYVGQQVDVFIEESGDAEKSAVGGK